VPLGVRQGLLHGTDGPIVPLGVSQHDRQGARQAGDHHVPLTTIQHGDPFDGVDPSSPPWP
jgi:hypothetical protein